MNKIDKNLFEEKVGYDWANKKMLVRVYEPLKELVEGKSDLDKSWANVIRYMFVSEKREKDLRNIAIGGYYSTIRTILKDIKVIKYEGKKLVKGANWNRFYGPEGWGWFVTNTNCGGWAEIINPNEMPY
jgi:hypothetical protein